MSMTNGDIVQHNVWIVNNLTPCQVSKKRWNEREGIEVAAFSITRRPCAT